MRSVGPGILVAVAVSLGCSTPEGGGATPRDALAGYVAALQKRNEQGQPDPDRPLLARKFFPPSVPAEVENKLRVALALTSTLVAYQVELVDIRINGPRATALVREASIFQHANVRFPPQDAMRREREFFLVQENGRWYIDPPDISPMRKKR